ncbi:MAG: hypothetical protein AB7E51_06655 [Pseudodesulfovibrio sp.]|uniref:hypothetical protein n=1 Tax=Pseudodesulfovibrio sp. TaxID=2035812 RepID=UPI003D0A86AB
MDIIRTRRGYLLHPDTQAEVKAIEDFLEALSHGTTLGAVGEPEVQIQQLRAKKLSLECDLLKLKIKDFQTTRIDDGTARRNNGK